MKSDSMAIWKKDRFHLYSMKSSQTDELTFLVSYVIYLMLVNHKHASCLKLSLTVAGNSQWMLVHQKRSKHEKYDMISLVPG